MITKVQMPSETIVSEHTLVVPRLPLSDTGDFYIQSKQSQFRGWLGATMNQIRPSATKTMLRMFLGSIFTSPDYYVTGRYEYNNCR